MNHCAVVQDLLPLYVDGAVSPDTRALVDEHLRDCSQCRQVLRDLQAPLAVKPLDGAGAAPSEEARFLTRLRRNVGTAIGAGLMLLLLTGWGASQYGEWVRDREYGRQMDAKVQAEERALENVLRLSPPSDGLLEQAGIRVEATPSRNGDDLSITYGVQSGADYLVTPRTRHDASATFRDPHTGKELKQARPHGGQSSWSGGQGSGRIEFGGLPAGPVQVRFEYPLLAPHWKVEPEQRWEFRRPGEHGEVPIGQRFTVRDIEFEVTRVLFQGAAVRVEYRQITDPAKAGVHFLTFRLSDRLGAGWSSSPLQELPDPLQPHQTFSHTNSPSQNWSLTVEYVALVIPGATVDMEVK